jgi:hypothetical protein
MQYLYFLRTRTSYNAYTDACEDPLTTQNNEISVNIRVLNRIFDWEVFLNNKHNVDGEVLKWNVDVN